MSQGLKENQGWVVADEVVFGGGGVVELAWSDGAVSPTSRGCVVWWVAISHAFISGILVSCSWRGMFFHWKSGCVPPDAIPVLS